MPKSETLHPKFREIQVCMPNGDKFNTRSTFSQDVLMADVSPDNHPAWTGKTGGYDANSDKVAKFQSKYGLNFDAI